MLRNQEVSYQNLIITLIHFYYMHCSKHSKAQAATEYILMTGVILSASLVIFFYTMFYSSDPIKISQALESAEAVARAVDYVYALGPGTQTIVDINLPDSVIGGYVTSYEVGFTLNLVSGNSDVYSMTKATSTGTLPTTKGTHSILVNYTETSGVVVEPL